MTFPKVLCTCVYKNGEEERITKMDAVKLLLQEPAGAIINVKKKNNSDLNCKRRMTAEVDYSPVFSFTEKKQLAFFFLGV